MDKTVEVSQAARDAAADHQDHKRGYVCSAPLRDGRADDCSIVQAFARFEAATRATQPEAALREAVEDGALERLEMHFQRLAQIARGTLECNTDDVRKLEETATYINQYRKEQR